MWRRGARPPPDSGNEKARHGLSRAGVFEYCDGVTLPVICPTCQTLLEMPQIGFGKLNPISRVVPRTCKNPLPDFRCGLDDFRDDVNLPLIRPTCQPRRIRTRAGFGRWIVRVSHENLLPARSMNVFKQLRFRLFLLLRQVSGLLRLSHGRRSTAVRGDHARPDEIASNSTGAVGLSPSPHSAR